MYLKSLEILGFKSFAERTTILFHPGVTAIVGPNGSGKSNVTDAIRWVLGEQSVKALRGGKMEDVIFSGTNSRRPLSYAEVTMLIDNEDGRLPLDYREVAITRRLYRSGESNYLINRQPCRMRDIHSLFMDTGLGRDGYSIIGQGRVDEILSTKSEDRRRVFEEASGIQKFRTKRDEAERRLEHTESNLTRVNDILNEISGRLLPLKEQSEQAKQYISWYDELKQLEVALILRRVDNFGQEMGEQEERYRDLCAETQRIEIQGQELETLNQSLRQRQDQLDSDLKASLDARETLGTELNRLTSAVALSEQRIEQGGTEIRRHETLLADHEGAKDKYAAELEERKRLDAELEQELAALDRERSAKKLELEQVLAGLETAVQRLNTERETLSRAQHHFLDCQTENAYQETSTQLLAQEKTRLEAETATLTEEKIEAESGLRAAEEVLEKLRAEDAERRREYGEWEINVQEKRAALEEARERYNRQAKNVDQLAFRLDAIKTMERNLEGYNEPVRRILAYGQQDPRFSRSLIGTIGDLFRVAGEYETAIETALGSAVQNIVVRDSACAQSLIRHLKQEKMGRVTFLPLSEIKTRELDGGLLARLEKWRGKGYLGQASDLVAYDDPTLEIVCRQLLARVVVASDMNVASDMARSFGQTLRVVTLEGEIISPGGAISGGSYRNRGPSLLSRKREGAELALRLKQAERELDLCEKQIDTAERVVQSAGDELESLAMQGMKMQQDLARSEAMLKEAHQNTQRKDAALINAQARLSALSERDENMAVTRQASLEKQRAAEQAIVTVEQSITRLETENAATLAQREALRDAFNEVEQRRHHLQEKRFAERRITERIHNESDQIEEKQRQEQELLERSQNDLAAEKQLLEKSRTSRAVLEKNLQDKLETYQGLEKELADVTGRANELFNQLKAHNSRLSALEGEKNHMELRMEQLRLQCDESKNRLWENYNLTYDNAADYRQADIKSAAAEPRIRQLKQAIRKLGPVNVNAVEDYAKLTERHDFLQRQAEDVQKARSQLVQVIAELTAGMREQFAHNFAQINANFQTVFAELFGGGQAEISLGVQEDILEAEIEIKASPPGKKLQNMLLLSGGERSLCAIALLFAILKLRPTPFCVLDEIEAALDDTNVFRFTNFIRHYAKQSQFILVTHRKGTMEAADSLYGVTMQERGISRILSMKLGE